MSVHQNSIEAYQAIHDSLGGRRQQIYSFLMENGEATDRDVKTGLNLDDMNMVRPRITELLGIGAIVEKNYVIDVITNRKVRVVALK